jgi:hypothetical protein
LVINVDSFAFRQLSFSLARHLSSSGYRAQGFVLADTGGLRSVKAFGKISDAKVRHSVVRLVEQIVGEDIH